MSKTKSGTAIRHDTVQLGKMVEKALARGDGWANLLTGMGTTTGDRKMSTTFVANAMLDETSLMYIYAHDGLGARIIDVPVEDMLRQGFKVTGDTDGLVYRDLKTFNGIFQIERALKWGSLYGGAIAVIGIDDGGIYEVPVRESGIRRITHLHVYDRYRTSVTSSDLYSDPSDRKFREPQFYNVSPIEGAPFRVHESRVLRFEGMDVPERLRLQQEGWGSSDLQRAYVRLKGLGEGYLNVEHIIGEFVLGVLTIQNLQEMIAAGKENLVKKRLALIDQSKHVLNTILLDVNEQFQRQTATVSGLDGLVRMLVQALSATTSIPVTVLMGESPAGLNATGASDIRRYYDMVKGRQENRLEPQLVKLIKYIMLARDGSFKGRVPDNWQVEFEPLWQPTEAEIADLRLKVAQADTVYLDRDVVSPEEIRASRFGGDQYSMDVKLSTQQTRSAPDDDSDKDLPDQLPQSRT